MAARLTAHQAAALEVIDRYQREQGFPPTRRELAGFMGWTAPSSAQRMIDVLISKGVIERVAARHGVIRVTDTGAEALQERQAA